MTRSKSWLILFVTLLALCSLNMIVRQVAARHNAPPEVRDFVYATHNGTELHMELHMPAPSLRPPRIVVFIHGGGWLGGSYKDVAGFVPMLTKSGFAVASAQYRFSNVAPFPAQIHDCKAAIRYLRAHEKELGIDASRIGVMGASAGGHLAALLGVSGDVKTLEGSLGNLEESSKVQAVVDWYGPTDLTTVIADLDSVSPAPPPDMRSTLEKILSSLVGGPLQEKQSALKSASPLEYISQDDAPVMIFHGTADPIVAYCQSVKFADALHKKGIEAELVTMEGKGHEIFTGPELDQIPRFFRHHLRKD